LSFLHFYLWEIDVQERPKGSGWDPFTSCVKFLSRLFPFLTLKKCEEFLCIRNAKPHHDPESTLSSKHSLLVIISVIQSKYNPIILHSYISGVFSSTFAKCRTLVKTKAVQDSPPVLPAGGSVYVVVAASMGSGKLLSCVY
jgi:hypothetical protein